MGERKIVKRWFETVTMSYEVTLTVGELAHQLGLTESAIIALLEAGALMSHPRMRNTDGVFGSERDAGNIIDSSPDGDVHELSITLAEKD